MLTKNPDPNIDPIPVAMYNGFMQAANGTLRTRYDILKDLNAPETLQREMQNLIAYLILVGSVCGIMFGIVIGIVIGKVI